MDDETWSNRDADGQTSQPDQNRGVNMQQLRAALLRRSGATDSPQVLKESVSAELHEMSAGKKFVLFIVFVLLPLFLATFFLGYYFFLPRWIRSLPSKLIAPSEAMPTYKRVISGTMEFAPLAPSASDSGGLASFASSGSVAFVITSDVIARKGFEGALRMDFDKPNPLLSQTDLDVNYKFFWAQNNKDFNFYFLASRWPARFGALDTAGISMGKWLRYSSAEASSSTPASGERTIAENAAQTTSRYVQALNYLLNRALEHNAVSWGVARFVYPHTSGAWVTDISVTVDQTKLPAVLQAMQTDPVYLALYKDTIEQPIGETSLYNLVSSLQSAKGTVTVGTFKKVVYDTKWTVETRSKELGAFHLQLGMSITPLLPNHSITAPPSTALDSGDLTVLLLMLQNQQLIVPLSDEVDTGTDSDGDGITDFDENILGTDPFNADTDNDGIPDLVEIQRGLNPLGAGAF